MERRPANDGGGHRKKGLGSEGESGPIGVAEEGCDGTGIALIVPFWRNGASRKSQRKDINLSGELEAARELWRTMRSWMPKGITRIMGGAVAVKPTAYATGETVWERSKREWLRKWRLVQEGVG